MSTTLIPPGVPVSPSDRERQRHRQRLLALEEANRIYRGRAALLHRLGALPQVASIEMAVEMLQDPPDLLADLPVEKLLLRLSRFGPVLARKVAAAAEVDGFRPLGALSDVERVRLVTALQLRRRLGG